MIESWRALVRAVRRSRPALVPLLAVLITAHLASAAHSAPFAGPSIGVVAICPPQHHPADGPQQPVRAADPAHDHDGGTHFDHSVDRPRDPGTKNLGTQDLDTPALPGLAPLSPDPAPAPGTGGPPRPAGERAGPPGCDGDRSVLGVWRQ